MTRLGAAIRFVMGLVLALVAGAGHAAKCEGKFVNPITEICWSCAFPMSLAGAKTTRGQEDSTSGESLSPACLCKEPPIVGLTVSSWQPVRRIDVTMTPYCFVSLGGLQLDVGFRAPVGDHKLQGHNRSQESTWQAHWYIDPMLYYLELVLDDRCMDTGSFDLAYLTEVDPTWNDSDLVRLLNPEVFLVANAVATAACAGDCAMASVGFGSDALWWCAGCNGGVYPMNGSVAYHQSMAQATSLVMQRFTAKMHRELLLPGTTGKDALCGLYAQPVMKKGLYKYQMLAPVPQTAKTEGRCCQPFGRNTMVWGAGKEIPVKRPDYAYQLWRKRDCCQGVWGL